jgi:type VI secretion system protein ImpF
MAKAPASQPLLPSVLDRLIDSNPELEQEPPASRFQLLRELRESVRRDLEMLLNTRIRPLDTPTNLTHLKQSLVNFGVPDFTGVPMGAQDEREAFGKRLERIIKDFEPRFKNVKVQLLSNTEPLDRTLRFRIEALLNVDPAPEPILFDSILHPVKEGIEVKGVGE